jgi:hypothetical protein
VGAWRFHLKTATAPCYLSPSTGRIDCSFPNTLEIKPQRTQRAQRVVIFLCVLCALCGFPRFSEHIPEDNKKSRTVDHKRFKCQTLFDISPFLWHRERCCIHALTSTATITLIYGWRARMRLQPADGWVRDAILDHNHRILNRKGVKRRKEVTGKK